MPTTPIQQLPRAAADAPIYLVRFVGPFTPDEIARKKKSFEVRKDVVVRFDAFLREHNALPAYSAAVNSDVVDAMPDVGLAAGVQVQLVDVEQSGMNVQQREALERDQLGLDVDADRQHRTVMTSAAAPALDLVFCSHTVHGKSLQSSSQVARSTEAGRAAAAARASRARAHGRRRSRCDWREGVHGVHLHVLRRSLARSIRSTPTPRRAPSS
jgi:hypothetical protein